MQPNYSGNKRRREEANRKKQEEKRNRRLNKNKVDREDQPPALGTAEVPPQQ